MVLRDADQFSLEFFADRAVVVQSYPAELTSDAGLLPFREFDQRWRYSARMAACLSDARVDHDRVPPEFRRAQPATWRSRLIKVAATVITTTRRVFVQLGGGWPFLELGRAIIKRAHTVPAKP